MTIELAETNEDPTRIVIRKPNPTDARAGARLRLGRRMAELSQEKLAALCGLTFQQIQKYEAGTNRIGSSRLYQLAGLIGQEVEWFFRDEPGRDAEPDIVAPRERSGIEELAQTPEGIKLHKAFASIEDAKVRRRVVSLVQAMGESAASASEDRPVVML